MKPMATDRRKGFDPAEVADKWLGRVMLFLSGALFVLTIDLLMAVK